ncbi:MAG: N-acetyltransferase [Taibaiella sp.]|nr:N-acetyltransferase [Taibaiella sp.]
MNIRQERKADIKDIYEINTLAFGSEKEAKLVDLLRASKAFVPQLSLVAALQDKIVGHILFSKINITDHHHNEQESLALAPMAVRPEFQRRGIGAELIRNGLHHARVSGFTSVIVLGHELYYPKFGFTPAERWNISPPYDVPARFFMALELVPDGLTGVRGLVRYPEAFDTL